MNYFSGFLEKTTHLLEQLSSRPELGGLQISNIGIQYIGISGKTPKAYSFRFPPGVVVDGHIQDKEQFKNILSQLHDAVLPGKPTQIIQIVGVLPSSLVYTQSFTIPNVGEEKLEESVILNLQMISPLPPASSYMSWQMLSESVERYELLGAFIEASIVDELKNIFTSARFYPVAFEFPSLSISRLLATSARTKEKNILLLQVSSDGINLSIIRRNKIHFDYFRSWRSIQGEDNQISRDRFNQVIVEEVRKVINFSMSKFREKIDAALLVAPGFEEEVKKVIGENFSITIEPLAVAAEGMSPVWYVPLGAAKRDMMHSGKREEYINLNRETSADIFFEEYTSRFVRLWRNVFILVLGFFLVVFLSSYLFLRGQRNSIQGTILSSKTQVNQNELDLLKEKAERFNTLVGALQSTSNNVGEWRAFLGDFLDLAEKNKITVDRIDISSLDALILVSATSPDNMSAIAFKNTLSESGRFENVVIPLLSIKELENGSVGFSLSFSLKQRMLR